MKSILKNSIQYYIDSEKIPDNLFAFKQFMFQETLMLSDEKPDISKINRVIGKIDVNEYKVINTSKGLSIEGYYKTGWQLVVTGEVKEKIEYVLDEEKQSVHIAYFSIPFSSSIILPEGYENGQSLRVEGYIEDIYLEQIDARTIFNGVSILINANPI